MTDPGTDTDQGAEVGWIRAIASAAAVLVVGFAAAVLGSNEILTRLSGVDRHGRQYLATALFFVVIVAMAWVLRRLQARKLI